MPIYLFALFAFVLAGYPSHAASSESLASGAKSDQQEKVLVGDMSFVKEENGAERVCFSLSRFCIPEISSIPGKKPRIVIDVKGVPKWYGKPRTQVNGNQIEQVRIHLHKAGEKLRIVLDLNPSLDFMVEPRYYEAERLYCVYVLPK